MENQRKRPAWLTRLIGEIERSKRSMRSISLDAGLGENYIQQMIGVEGKDPGFDSVAKICDTLNISITYLVTGAQMSHFEEEVLFLLASLDDRSKNSLLVFLRSLVPTGGPSQ